MLRKLALGLMFVGMSALATGCVVEVAEVSCTFDSDCGINEFCGDDGLCYEVVEEVVTCIDDLDCAAGELCVDGLCSIVTIE